MINYGNENVGERRFMKTTKTDGSYSEMRPKNEETKHKRKKIKNVSDKLWE